MDERQEISTQCYNCESSWLLLRLLAVISVLLDPLSNDHADDAEVS